MENSASGRVIGSGPSRIACWANQGVLLPADEHLIEELLTPTYEVQAGRIQVMRKDTMRELLKRSPDRADALCLTFAPGGFFDGCDLP